MDDQEILCVKELAQYLKVPKSTIYSLVREARIPSHKVGRHWRFRKRTIDIWLDQRPNEVCKRDAK